MAKKKEEKPEEAKSKEENIVDEEKAEEKAEEKDYNSIFDDDYVEEEEPEVESEEMKEEETPEEEVNNEGEEKESDQSSDSPPDSSSDKKNKKDKSSNKSKKEDSKEKEKEPEKEKNEEAALDKPVVKKNKSGAKKKILIVLAVLFALLAGAFGGYLYFKNTNKPKEETKSTETTNTAPSTETKASKDVYVTAEDGLNMREKPDKSAKVLAVIPFGTKLSVLEQQTGWDKVEYNGQQGWIVSDYVSETKPEALKTYTGTGQVAENPKFSVKYPADWNINDYKISKSDGGKDYSIVLGAGGHGFSEGDASITSTQENVTVNGNTGTKTTATKDGKIVLLVVSFQKGNGYINLEFAPPVGYDASYIEIYNKIVQTFKFL